MTATASRIVLDPGFQPVYAVPGVSQASADKASALLQENHEKHHIFFNDRGFHNHIVHHQLSLYALGAPPAAMQKQYDGNAGMQRPPQPQHPRLAVELADASTFDAHLGQEKYYPDFLEYFRQRIEATGWQQTINEHMFKGDARADDFLVRCFAGLIHPIIHLGYGVEFEQPAIIAEALAQAAIHSSSIAPLFLEPERVAREQPAAGVSPTLLALARQVHADRANWRDAVDHAGEDIPEGIVARKLADFARLAAQYRVTPATLAAQTDEVMRSNAVMVFGAASDAHVFKPDFFNLHGLNCSVFFGRFLRAPWLREADKVRLLEWKARSDLAVYADTGAPELRWERVAAYEPRKPSDGWGEIYGRVFAFDDDSHIVKMLRALANGAHAADEARVDDVVLDQAAWLRMAHMAIDAATESGGPPYVFRSGLDESWSRIPARRP